MIRKLLLAVLVLTSGAVGYGAVAHGYIINSPNRNPWFGYFANIKDTAGTQVLPENYDGNIHSIPDYIGDGVGDDAQELIDFMNANRQSPANWNETGSAFIVATMMPGGGTVRTSDAAFSDWAQAIHYNADQGAISWHYTYTYSINTYYQAGGGGPDDDAFFCVGIDTTGTGSCSGTNTGDVILFNMNGRVYAIRRQCANPVMNGGLTSINVSPGWWITPHTVPVEATANVGNTVHFKHYLKNNGPASDYPNYVWWDANDGLTGAGTIAGNPYPGGIIPGGQDALAAIEPHVVDATDLAAGKVCRTTGVQPNSYWDTSYLREPGNGACIPVTGGNYTLTPSILATVNGVSSSTAEVGDNVVFTFAVTNSGPDPSPSVSCTVYGLSRTGSYTAPSPADSTSDAGYSPPATGCPKVFTPGANPLGSQAVDGGAIIAGNVNKTICRSMYVSPATNAGGSANTEACVRIVAKPYMRVYGGDISAGGGFGDSCSTNNGAAVIGWNRRLASSPTWAGAGAEYAIYAMSTIFDAADAFMGNTGPARADAPGDLSFANTSTFLSAGRFGGGFGSVPCIHDYYADRPATTLALPASINAMTTGTYGANTNTYFGTFPVSNIDPGERITVYIDGDVYINTNIVYTGAGTWSSGNIPSFKLVVRGNIYIDLSITQLDGLYVAEPNGASGGTIYTCAMTVPALFTLPSTTAIASQCNTKLTVNGSFIAKQVQFLRTKGAQSQSSTFEPSTSANIGEVFNYSPMLWIPQPAATTGQPPYDAIVSLPPVL